MSKLDEHDHEAEEFSDIEPEPLDGKGKPVPKILPENVCPVSEDERGEDVSYGKKGAIYKKILVPGSGVEHPKSGVEVTVHYTGRLLNNTKFDSSVDRNEPFKFDIGKRSVIRGWDEGVESMLRGEKCILTIRPDYAYGANGSPPKIPANAWLQFEVELLDWEEPAWMMTKEVRYQKSAEKKDAGNDFFRQNNLKAAIHAYESAKVLLDAIRDVDAVEQTHVNELCATLLVNQAACHLKLKAHISAIETTTKAIALQPLLTKAYFRRAIAEFESENTAAAKADFAIAVAQATDRLQAATEANSRTAIELELSAIHKEEQRLTQKLKLEQQRQRDLYAGWAKKV